MASLQIGQYALLGSPATDFAGSKIATGTQEYSVGVADFTAGIGSPISFAMFYDTVSELEVGLQVLPATATIFYDDQSNGTVRSHCEAGVNAVQMVIDDGANLSQIEARLTQATMQNTQGGTSVLYTVDAVAGLTFDVNTGGGPVSQFNVNLSGAMSLGGFNANVNAIPANSSVQLVLRDAVSNIPYYVAGHVAPW